VSLARDVAAVGGAAPIGETSRMRIFLSTMVLLGTLAATLPADACFNVTQAEVDAQTKKVKKAEGLLDGEDHGGAHRVATEAIHFLGTAKRAIHPDGKLRSPEDKPVNPPDPSLLQRAYRIDALAISRAPKGSQGDRDAAVKTFETEVLGATPDPSLLADYAEVLSRTPARTSQATMMLRALRDKDLIGSANAFLALAKLEKVAGNAEAEKAARDRCRSAATKKAICET
jgi:hypothetical protein